MGLVATLPFSSMKLLDGERTGSGMVARREDMGTSSSLSRLASAACTAACMAPGGREGGGGGGGGRERRECTGI